MLSGEQMDKIQEEENFRHEARKKLEAKRSAASIRGKLWKLLNSSFALWFLSSVVLASLTWAFTEYQRYVTEENAKAELKQRISTEITFRIANGIIQNNLDTERLKSGEQFSPYSAFLSEFNYLNNDVYDRSVTPPFQIDYSVYNEYKTRKFRSLLAEIRSAVEKGDTKYLHDADQNYLKLENLVDVASIKAETSKVQINTTAADMQTVLTFLLELQNNPIWKNAE